MRPLLAMLIKDLAKAVYLPAAALRVALDYPDDIAEGTLPILEKAATGAELGKPEVNILFWGLHVLAACRDIRALPPLLTLLRQDREVIEAVLGGVVEATLSRMLASLFDGQTDPLFRLILDSSLDQWVRQAVIEACTFLCVDKRIERESLHRLMVRFDDAKAAVEGDVSWNAWEEAIVILGFRDLVPRIEDARKDGRIDTEFSDLDWLTETLRKSDRDPDREAEFCSYHYGYLDDPIAALEWTRKGHGDPVLNPHKNVGRNDPCPCGSGVKFKKCCLDKLDVEVPWTPPVR